MKKTLCAFRVSVCLIWLLAVSGNVWAEDFDFRGIRWGMNRFEVMASEDGAPRRMKRDEILYRISLFKRPAHLMYRFYEDRLVGARYVLPVKGVDTLDKLESLVSLRYGDARKETAPVGPVRVWYKQDRTIRLFIAKKGQAVIDVLSEGAFSIPSKQVALLRRSTLDVVARSL
ncbi:hypothetical protein DSLASN_21420 [Desulfoluna limicola]|uniref:Uncharacterized protein n=1 Tax=Desulfoluna limicola TaxID=2810562 RepID=A0ABM7PHD9_9BACT|nr:hypothetical protein [Desulfoluna limicola]BCS96510.1 hypothetical protein DSLASN_21420 [Desulfoluna limicola]